MRRLCVAAFVLTATAVSTASASPGDRRTSQLALKASAAQPMQIRPSASRPFRTAISDEAVLAEASAPLAVERIRRAGASIFRLGLYWRNVAPPGSRRPAGFQADDPSDPAYRWEEVDKRVRLLAEHGLDAVLVTLSAPDWAEGQGTGPAGTVRPNAVELASFAKAAALRYSGSNEGLPRVRYWQAWNEPNIDNFLTPQRERGRLVSPAWYRTMVNRFAAAVHGVRRDNVVIAGGLSPFSVDRGGTLAIGPLRFMRELLCLPARGSRSASCAARVAFDVWAHHPYTTGGPSRAARHPDDVSLADLPEMRVVLEQAARAGRIVGGRPEFWVTEFSWDTAPPDPNGLPIGVHAQWVAEAFYRMWDAGVSVATWLLLRDQPLDGGTFIQAGLYFRGRSLAQDRPKPALAAFRFPFVALRERSSTLVWGRTPDSRPGNVVIERSSGGAWRRVSQLRANRHGIFVARLPATEPRGSMRARLVGRPGTSLPFWLKRPRDRSVCPFGTC